MCILLLVIKVMPLAEHSRAKNQECYEKHLVTLQHCFGRKTHGVRLFLRHIPGTRNTPPLWRTEIVYIYTATVSNFLLSNRQNLYLLGIELKNAFYRGVVHCSQYAFLTFLLTS